MLYWRGKFVSSYSKFYEMHEIYILYSHTLSYMLPLKSFFSISRLFATDIEYSQKLSYSYILNARVPCSTHSCINFCFYRILTTPITMHKDQITSSISYDQFVTIMVQLTTEQGVFVVTEFTLAPNVTVVETI